MEILVKRNVKLTLKADGIGLAVSLPRPLSRSLQEAGYSCVDVFVTDDGVLLRPRVVDSGAKDAVVLPDWDGS